MEQQIIVLQNEAQQYGIQPSQVPTLIGNLTQIQAEREQLETQYAEILKLDIENPETSKYAKEIRLKIRENRTKGIAVWHKTTKEYFLRGGQFVDAIKRKEEAINVRMEEALEQIEKHQEIKIQKEKERIAGIRAGMVEPYREFFPTWVKLGDLDEDEFALLYNGAKMQYDQKQEEIKKAEEARLEAERKAELERIERERMAEEKMKAEIERLKRHSQNYTLLYPYFQFIDGIDFDTFDFAQLTDEEVSQMVDKAQKRKEIHEAEQKRLQQQAAENLRKLEEQRAKEAEEKRILEQKLKKEQEEKARLAAEIAENKAKEAAARKAEEAEKRRLKNAPDRDILLNLIPKIAELNSNIGKPKGEVAQKAVEQITAYLHKLVTYIEQQADKLK
jgi:colicin import membrane protein